jgi:cytochrome c biogenesis protein CcdA
MDLPATAVAATAAAGAFTVLAPCVLPLLPVVVGGSVADAGSVASRWRPWVVAGSLAASLVVFTLLLKVSTAVLSVDPRVWTWVSGAVLVLLGVAFVVPGAWSRLTVRSGFSWRSQEALSRSTRRRGMGGAVMTGAALGPVFSSCSPVYLWVVATVLPTETGRGLVLLVAYVTGLTAALLVLGLLGRRVVARVGRVTGNRWFELALGVVFVAVGVLVVLGGDKQLQTWTLDAFPGLAGWLTAVESRLLPAG